jgi:hypothetical protein
MDDMARRKQFKAEEKAREIQARQDKQRADQFAREPGEEIERQLRKEKGEPIE